MGEKGEKKTKASDSGIAANGYVPGTMGLRQENIFPSATEHEFQEHG